jgi:DMSO/TMAO reductase YedYZ molybdopterin-dependent catalytic subunit
VSEPVTLRLAELARLPRTELAADFHCVAGWSATGLRWEGVTFATFYRKIVEPSLRPGASVTHVSFRGLDGYRSVVTIEDALADDVLIAEHLDGRPLGADHGAPVRLVSPKQYGFINTKHLCRIELHTTAPAESYRNAPLVTKVFLRWLATPHPRARVWEEERHRYLPGRALRYVYRPLIAPIAALCARGSRSRGGHRRARPQARSR